ncbi:histidine--tRNA ligase [Embleya scabrispora]|uniref:Histidine--tRNA ligase n=1 Tax=Embleya scabrispora TaxID=159449 RepID=A0A1T3NWV9_9ACTN|nr:histidine--tRNA ligase [Embleya scabrispora]OPC81274.1 histidine--tRNA ligase [Embleya scabrispora]
MATESFPPPSGTRDFLAAEFEARERAFATVRDVFARFGFQPLQTPVFERLEVLTGKYGDEGDKLVFKILRRGEHEATGEADLALRYDHTVPLARVVAAYGSRLPTPYKRYALAPVWRADRPGKGRFREFVQCDLDVVGSASPLADAEVVSALYAALDALGVPGFRFMVNSRKVLMGLLEVYGVPADAGGGVLITLDKLDKLRPEAVIRELVEGRGQFEATASSLVADLTAPDSITRIRKELTNSSIGQEGLAEIDRLLDLLSATVPRERIAFVPSLVRGLDYYTGVIYEVTAPGMPGSIASGGRYDGLIGRMSGGAETPACGGSLGIERILPLLTSAGEKPASALDVAVTVLGDDHADEAFRMAAAVRRAGLRTGVYMGSSSKLARQLKWAAAEGARFCLIYGDRERDAGEVIVRDMTTGEQTTHPVDQVAGSFAE